MLLKKDHIPSVKSLTTEEVHHAFHDALMGFLVKKVEDKNLAEDLFQETLLKIHLNLDGLKDTSKLTSWVFQIARNVIADNLRKKKPLYNSESIEALDPQHDDDSSTPSALAMSGCIEGLLDALPEKYRDVLKLCDLSEKSQKEVSEILGLSLPALKSRLKRGRLALKDLLQGCCKSKVSISCESKTTSTSCGCQDFNEAS